MENVSGTTRSEQVDFWAMTTTVSSSVAHAFKDGKAICGSPLQASPTRWDTPGYIGCKKCLKIWLSLPKDHNESDS